MHFKNISNFPNVKVISNPYPRLLNSTTNIAILGADNMVVNTLKLFGHYYAATELPQIIEYDPVTLETLGKVDLTPLIPGKV